MYRDHPMRPATPSFDALKAAFLRHLALRNLSPLSIKQNEQALRFFIAYLEANKIKSIHAVGRGDFEGYIAQMGAYRTRKGTALCFNTLRARIFIIRDWFKFLRRKGLLHSDPAAGVRPPRVIRKLPRGVMSEEEIRRVMAQPDLHSILGYRDRAMMETLYSTGMRAAELTCLALDDVDLLKKTARIRHGKGEKQRNVLLSAPCVRFLERYLKDIRPELVQGIRPAGNNWLKKRQTGGDLLFLSIYGGPIARGWLSAMMKRYIRQAGITRPVSPVHGWRHSIATTLMSRGMDIRYVQTMLGHSSVDVTRIYTHVERKSLHAQLKTRHPSRAGKFTPFLGE